MTNPNNDPWVRGVFEVLGEDPDEEALDPNIPDSWRDEPGFLSISALGITEDPESRLKEYRAAGIKAEHRVLEVEGMPVDYIVLFIQEEANETG